MKKRNVYLAIAIFVFVAFLLTIVQLRTTERPLLLMERFFRHGGWIEVILIAAYGAFLGYQMSDPSRTPRYRRLSWMLFSIVFFSQFILGLLVDTIFLMTGKLHLPIPMMVLAGPIYRGQLSVMSLLFLSTIILTGPAWCSQYCYFGAMDGMASAGHKKPRSWKKGYAFKWTLFFLVVFLAWLFRFIGLNHLITTMLAIIFGLTGIAIIVWLSRRYGTMMHCVYYCPLGTLVNTIKWVNPFRLTITDSCTLCMRCTMHCRYDALNVEQLRKGKPRYTCTLCGDCIPSCQHQSIQYKFLWLGPHAARNLYLFLTISLHAVFLALARI
jgi:NAD-dependent dihydropyrimidine dehydrogenase PreA subunit